MPLSPGARSSAVSTASAIAATSSMASALGAGFGPSGYPSAFSMQSDPYGYFNMHHQQQQQMHPAQQMIDPSQAQYLNPGRSVGGYADPFLQPQPPLYRTPYGTVSLEQHHQQMLAQQGNSAQQEQQADAAAASALTASAATGELCRTLCDPIADNPTNTTASSNLRAPIR